MTQKHLNELLCHSLFICILISRNKKSNKKERIQLCNIFKKEKVLHKILINITNEYIMSKSNIRYIRIITRTYVMIRKGEMDMEQKYHKLQMPQFITGRGSISFFATLGKKRIGVICGGRSLNDELKVKIERLAEAAGAELCYLTQIRNEPYVEDIFRCMDDVRKFNPDMFLAIGGGSVMDTAKAIHLFYENPEMTFEEALVPFQLPPLGKKAILVAAPTTSGTGAEATTCGVFIDSVTREKKIILDHKLLPHYAILDANLTDSMPSSVTSATGMDALTHAIEAATAVNASAMVRVMAMEAAVDILENLEIVVSDGEMTERKKDAREKMHVAAGLAGVAITNCCTGIAHSYAHMGPAYSFAHGSVCGLMLPYSMKYVGIHPAYVTISKRLGYRGSDRELTQALIDHIFALMKNLNMKTTFKEFGISRDRYMEDAKVWAKISLEQFPTVVSSAEMTFEKGLTYYEEVFDGVYPVV